MMVEEGARAKNLKLNLFCSFMIPNIFLLYFSFIFFNEKEICYKKKEKNIVKKDPAQKNKRKKDSNRKRYSKKKEKI